MYIRFINDENLPKLKPPWNDLGNVTTKFPGSWKLRNHSTYDKACLNAVQKKVHSYTKFKQKFEIETGRVCPNKMKHKIGMDHFQF